VPPTTEEPPALGAAAIRESLKRSGRRRGVVTLCIGGGRGIALAIEML
jgi:acetyl-CoA C-acetyltransferase